MADFEAILGANAPAWLSSAQDSLQKGDAQSALEQAEQARNDYRRSGGSKKGEAAALVMVARAAFEVGRWEAATKASSEALHIFQAEKDKTGESAALMLVSHASLLAGDYEEAISASEDAALLAQKAGSTKQMAFSKAGVAEACVALLQTKDNVDPSLSAKALEAGQDAATAFRELQETKAHAKVLSNLAAAYSIVGNTNMALAKAKMAQRMYQADMNVVGEAQSLLVQARALQKEGSLDVALQTLADAASLFETAGHEQGQAEAYALMEQFQNLSIQERQDFTQRVMKRFDRSSEGGISSHSLTPGPKTHFFLPPQQPVTMGPATTKFIGFMGRAATVVPPKGAKGSTSQNRFLLYNVTWN